MDIQKSLQSIFDLTEKELHVYLALLELNSASATRISRTTNLNRTTIYDVAKTLLEKGLITQHRSSGKIIYNSVELDELPSAIDALERTRRQEYQQNKKILEQMMPALAQMQKPGWQAPVMKIYEGLPAVQRAYELTLSSHSEIRAYVDLDAELRALPHLFPGYWQRRVAAKIPIRTILIPSEVAHERRQYDVEELRQTRLLHTPHRFTAQIKVWDDKVLSIAWTAQVAVLIQSTELAQMQKDIFDALWETLPE